MSLLLPINVGMRLPGLRESLVRVRVLAVTQRASRKMRWLTRAADLAMGVVAGGPKTPWAAWAALGVVVQALIAAKAPAPAVAAGEDLGPPEDTICEPGELRTEILKQWPSVTPGRPSLFHSLQLLLV